MNILIVDDDIVSSTLVGRILQKNGYKTTAASSGEMAIKLLESGEPVFLIILDMIMPDMNGMMFMEYLNKRAGLNNIPVIICSGERFQGSVLQSVQMGAKDFIVKPINGDILAEKVLTIVRSEKPPLLDKHKVMSRIRIGPEEYNDMLNVLIQRGNSVIDEINGFLKCGDYNKIHCIVNGLKGGAISIGAERLAFFLVKMEEVVQQRDNSTIQDVVIGLKREINIIHTIVSPLISISHK